MIEVYWKPAIWIAECPVCGKQIWEWDIQEEKIACSCGCVFKTKKYNCIDN